jgi:nitrite reductase/ring-hydroxylating ferredoxin subunit/Fe-S cluster biogenesis protein NfuA
VTQTLDPRAIEEVARALDAATSRIAELEPLPRQVVTDSLESLNTLHKVGLTTIVRKLKDDPRGKELLFELVDEPEVRMILAMHGIIRPDVTTQARQVLEGVRAGLQTHGGDVELDSVREGIVYVRLHGACNGCSMAAVTMRDGVEKALIEGVPGVTGVEVLPNDPSPTLIRLSEIGVGAPREDKASELEAAGWCRAVSLGAVDVGELVAVTLRPTDGPSVDVIVVNAAGQLAAYVNECAHQGLPLDNAIIDATEGTLTCPWHGFCYDSTSGECMTMPGAQLQQLPLRVEGDAVWVRTVGA